MKYIIPLFILILAYPQSGQAQLLPFLTNHQSNAFLVNPAIPIVHRIINPGTNAFNYRHAVSMTYRDQWMKFGKLRPRTYTASYHHYLKPSDHGINFWAGGYLFRDQIGASSQTGAFTTFSAHANLGHDQYLSAGLTLGGTQYAVENSRLNTGNLLDFDRVLAEGDTKEYLFDPGIGIFYTNKAFFTGISLPKIVGITANGSRQRLHHYYVIFGTTIQKQLGPFKTIEPFLWLRTVRDNAAQMNLNIKAEFNALIPMWVVFGIDNSVAIHLNYGLIIPMGGRRDLRMSFGYDNQVTFFNELGGTYELSVSWLMR